MILYAKYSNERRRSLSIRTEIREENGVRTVLKMPQYPEAEGHVAGIAAHANELAELFANSDFRVNRCDPKDGAVSFEYLEGRTYEEYCDEVLKKGPKDVEVRLREYLDRLDALSDTDFVLTDDFRRVFGETGIANGSGVPAFSVSDIDLVLNNIVMKDGLLHVIDYEWTFSFPVPVSFVKWRVLHYYLRGNSARLSLPGAEIMEHFGISSGDEAVYEEMERHFQEYVKGGYVPRRDLYGAISDGTIDIGRLTAAYEGAHLASVYTDSGNGYSEDERTMTKVSENGEIFFSLPVSGIKKIRLDPLECPCYAEINQLKFDEEAADMGEFRSNGVRIGASGFFFTTEDPAIEIPVPSGAKRFTAQLRALLPENCPPEILKARKEAGETKLRFMERGIEGRDALIVHLKALAGEIRGMRSEKAMRKLASIAGREDPFRNFDPQLPSDPSGICLTVDEQVTGMDRVRLRGWCFDRTFGNCSLTLLRTDGTKVPCAFKRAARPDVAAAFDLDPSVYYGFWTEIPVMEAGDGKLLLEARSLRGYVRNAVRIETDPEKRAQLARTGNDPIPDEAYRNYLGSRPVQEASDAERDAFEKEWVFAEMPGLVFDPSAYDAFSHFAAEHPECELIYCDDDLLSGSGVRTKPRFKPDADPDYLMSYDYIGGAFAVKKDRLREMGYEKVSFADEPEVYAFLLTASAEIQNIGHLPQVLASMTEKESFERTLDRCADALRDYFQKNEISADVTADPVYGVLKRRYQAKEEPLLTVVIPNMDHREDLRKCVNSLRERGGWDHLEILIVENNSKEEETFRLYKELQEADSRVKCVTYEGEFDYAAINNFGVRSSDGEYILFLNNDTEVISDGAVRVMMESAMRPEIGAVGAKLYFGDNTIQHAGVIIGYGGFAGHCMSGADRAYEGYMKRAVCEMDLSAVTAACLLVPKELFLAAGGFTAELKISLNDIDLCLKLRDLGYRVLFQPAAEFYHYESKSRGYEDSPEKKARFEREKQIFMNRWEKLLKEGDPYYHPALTLERPDFSLR